MLSKNDRASICYVNKYADCLIKPNSEEDKEILRKNCYLRYQKSHNIVIEKLRKEKRKLRVCFLVSENQKWNCQSLYDALEKSVDFYPFVLVTRLKDMVGRTSYQDNVNFFKKCCKNVEIGFDERTNSSIDIKLFKPDILFYQQPWGINDNQSPLHVISYALSYYFPYAVGNVDTCLRNTFDDFFLTLQKQFVFSEEEKQQCIDICDSVKSNSMRSERFSLLNELKIVKVNSTNEIIGELLKDIGRSKRIITYGTFDVLHYGHINLLKRAKALGNYLIVGLSTDEFNQLKHKKSFYTYEQRKIILEAIKYVDLIIPETSWEQKISDIKMYKVDAFVMGSDWVNKFDFLKDYCEVIYLERTQNVCSTSTREYLRNIQ